MKKAAWIGTGVGVLCLAVAGFAQLGSRLPVTYLPSGWRLSPTGPIEKIGDMAAGGKTSPNGKFIAFVTVGQGNHKLYTVNAETGKPVSELALGRAWIGMDWFADSKRIAVSGGTSPVIHLVEVSDSGELKLEKAVSLTGVQANRAWLAGLELSDDEKSAYVAVSASDEVRKVDLETGATQLSASMPKASSPYQLCMTKYGLAVTLQGAEQVALLAPDSLETTSTFGTGRHPNDMVVRDDRLFVACGSDDFVDVFDLYNLHREERIVTKPWPDAPPGSTPHALALSKDGEYLLAANSDNNCVAVIEIEQRGAARVKGFIPTGAYPSAVAVLADDRTVVTAAGKGYGTGPNGDTSNVDPIAPKGYPYIVVLLQGLLSKAPFRDGQQLQQMTAQVRDLSPYKPGVASAPLRAPKSGTNPIPSKLGDKSPIEHVLYIIK